MRGSVSKKSIHADPFEITGGLVEFSPEIKLELSLGVLSGVQGVFLTEEQIHEPA